MPSYQNVAIIGVGLLGGSIGLALGQRGLAKEIIGVGRRQSSLDKALHCGAINRSTTDLAEGVAGAEVVIVATPVASIVDDVSRAIAAAPTRALITDVGSTKARICNELEKKSVDTSHFVGSHPLAGGHKTGPEHAQGDLLEGKVVVVTPSASTPTSTVESASALWQALGAKVLHMAPDQHDQALASTSHLPHLIASALAATTPAEWLPLAASGWADTTRVAAADPELWAQIFSQNTPDVIESLDRLTNQLQAVRANLESEDWSAIQQFLQQAKRTRDALGN